MRRATVWLALAWSLGCSKTPEPPAPEPVVASEASSLKPQKAEGGPRVTSEGFGAIDGKAVERYTLTNARGLTLKVITYGAIITELSVPDRNGQLGDIVLGFDDLDSYVKSSPYFGAIVGRVANRIRNAKFELNGKQYALAANNGEHHLHGGVKGWDKLLWSAEPATSADSASLRLSLVSPDGDEGYPGTVTASVTYTLTNSGELDVDMRAKTDRATPVNLAQHSYFNLGGIASGSVRDQVLTLFADAYTPGDPQIPDGRVVSVDGTPFDFTRGKPIGRDLAAAGLEPAGYDHDFVVRGDPHTLRPVARAYDPRSGRLMTLDADQPGVQLYTGNHLKGAVQGKGVSYEQHAGFCLETQKFPNAVNVPAWRDDAILQPEQEYRHHMRYRFSTEPATAGAQ